MPTITIKNKSTLKYLTSYDQVLKCSIVGKEVKMIDLERIDLYTENGIRRQLLCLLGRYKNNFSINKLIKSSEILRFTTNCFELRFEDYSTISKFITQEYLNAVNHYFGKKIKLYISGNSLFCESKSPVLASRFYIVLFADLCDNPVFFNKTKFLATKKVIHETLSKKEYLFLSRKDIMINFGSSFNYKNTPAILKKMAYKVMLSVKRDGYLVQPPFFRTDIFSVSDILEDIMLLNLNNFKGNKEMKIMRRGVVDHDPVSNIEKLIVNNLLSFGFKELSLFSHKGLPLRTSIEADTVLRSSIIPSLLNFEISNQHIKYPHRLFEIDTVLDNFLQKKRLGIIVSENNVDFNELYSIVYRLILDLFNKNIYLDIEHSKYFEEGCSFKIMNDKNRLGTIGFLSLGFAKEHGLKTNCLCLEIDLDLVIK